MSSSHSRRHIPHADALLACFSTRQYLHPHQSVAETMTAAQGELGVCPMAAQTALDWLQINPERPIGRLRRCELVQLSRSIHRFWLQALADASQPA